MSDFNEIFNVVAYFTADAIAEDGEISPCFIFAVPEKELTFRLIVIETEIADMTVETDEILEVFSDLNPIASFHVFEDVYEEKGRVLIIFGCSIDSRKSTVTPLTKKDDGIVHFGYPIETNVFEHNILDRFKFEGKESKL